MNFPRKWNLSKDLKAMRWETLWISQGHPCSRTRIKRSLVGSIADVLRIARLLVEWLLIWGEDSSRSQVQGSKRW